MNARPASHGEVFDIEAVEAEDLRAEVERAIAEADPNDLAPLAGLILPAPSIEYTELSRFLESIETGKPLAEARGRRPPRRTV